MKPFAKDTDIKQHILEAIQDINNEYGQDYAVRIYKKSLDYDEYLHFEFDQIFGMVAYMTEDHRILCEIIKEDDDFWMYGKGNTYENGFHNHWLKSLESVTKRMREFIKTEESVYESIS